MERGARVKKSEDARRESWERQENESAKAYAAFAAYRDMGVNRSLAKIARRLGKSKALMDRWSAVYHWVARVDAWEAEKDRAAREELTKGVTAMRKRHVDIAEAMLTKAVKSLRRLPPGAMTMRDIATAVEVAAKLERLSRGETTEKTEGKTALSAEVSVRQLDLSHLTDEELERLDEIAGKIVPTPP
jgi:hypothetical protein